MITILEGEAMTFQPEHQKYADAVMTFEAYKLFGKTGPSTGAAKKASYNRTIADDKKERPGSPMGWHTATANSVNRVIEDESRKAIKAAGKKMVKDGKLISGEAILPETLLKEAALLMPAAMLAGQRAKAPAPSQETQSNGAISRRQMLGLTAGLAVGAFFLNTAEAHADNVSYVNNVKNNVGRYSKGKAQGVVRGVGAGIRADLDAPRPQYG